MARAHVTRIESVTEQSLLPGSGVRFIHSDNMTFAHWRFESGIELPQHAHPHEQVTQLVEGDFELCIEGEVYRLQAGDMVVIPGGAVHSGRALSACKLVDTFCPVREDYL